MNLIRLSLHIVLVALVMTLAVVEVSWMGDRVSAQRAARGDHGPGKVITLPLTGLK